MNQTAWGSFINTIGPDTLQRLEIRLKEVNRDVETKGISPFQKGGNYTIYLLTGYSYNEFYDWDLYFENIYLSYYGISKFNRRNIEMFLDNQLECGFVARTLKEPRWRQHFKPFMAQVSLFGSRQTESYGWLKGKYYEALKKYLDYWFWFSDFDKNGLAVWDSADHSGMDNQDLRAGKFNVMEIEGVDLNCYLYRELQAMAVIAENLGLLEDKVNFEKHAEKLAELINTVFWDEKDGFYYDRNERKGELVRYKSIAGFIPLWLGIVPKERAERLVREHILNPEEFWLKFPLATWAKNEEGYYQQRIGSECNWMGATWVPTNYMVFQGLRKYGYNDVAKELAYKTFDLVLSEEATREYFDGETGIGQGLNPFWGWSTLAYFMPLEFELGYDPTDITCKNIQKLGMEYFNLNMEA
jgi:putative isomerase